MTENQLDSLISTVRSNEVCYTSINNKLQRLLSQEKRQVGFIPSVQSLATVAFGIILFIGLLSTVHFVNDARMIAQTKLQDQAEMIEARNDMLSNTEHIYTVLFKSQ